MLACTPPAETSPSRWSRSAGTPRAGLRCSRKGAVLDRLVDAQQILLDDGAGAEVQVPDLRVPHLPLGQPDGLAPGGQRGVGVGAPELVEDRRIRQLDGVPGAGLRSPSRRAR